MSTLLKEWLLRFDLKPIGVVHAGAHLVQERDLYKELNMEPVLWIEAHPTISKTSKNLLANYSKQRLVNAALWRKSGELMQLTEAGNEGSSSSLLDIGLITASHPQVVARRKITVCTFTLAEILKENRDFTSKMEFLLVDTQGAESEVIEGLGDQISQFKYIFAEVSTKKLYKKSMLFKNFIKLLELKNFQLLCSHINNTTGWGDAFFVRKDILLSMGIKKSKFDHIKVSNGLALATRLRQILIKIGLPNSVVARISKKQRY
jgi:FkbM family methyltransferase